MLLCNHKNSDLDEYCKFNYVDNSVKPTDTDEVRICLQHLWRLETREKFESFLWTKKIKNVATVMGFIDDILEK